MPDGLWLKCPGCKKTVYKAEVEANMQVCPACSYHHRITARARIEAMVDPETFEETHTDIQTVDPLTFTVGETTYLSKVHQAKEKSGLQEALITGIGQIEGARTVIAAMDPYFMGGSMGSAVGEKFCRATEDALRERLPMVAFTASGGARMQEGILSLMQMAKTADAVGRLNEAGLPYITVLTDPTYGGVYASFATLGDFIVAEPGAMCGFAGPRLIEGALKVKLPEGFQSAEYQLNNGFLDQIVKRTELKPLLGKLLRYISPQ
jgi:acetyl-CoA carboxylase carboxyl transferase subunit beta